MPNIFLIIFIQPPHSVLSHFSIPLPKRLPFLNSFGFCNKKNIKLSSLGNIQPVVDIFKFNQWFLKVKLGKSCFPKRCFKKKEWKKQGNKTISFIFPFTHHTFYVSLTSFQPLQNIKSSCHHRNNFISTDFHQF